MDRVHLFVCCFLLFCFLITLITRDNAHKERCTGTKSHALPKSILKNITKKKTAPIKFHENWSFAKFIRTHNNLSNCQYVWISGVRA